MCSVDDAATYCARYPGAAGFVLDSHRAGAAGGSGEAFDWTKVPVQLSRPWLLAGGLGPETVAAAIMATQPWGVDVSSGIESAPGIKDGEKMLRFVQEVERVDRSEEHTSELQSLMRISYAVFCLQKKKQNDFTTRSNVS